MYMIYIYIYIYIYVYMFILCVYIYIYMCTHVVCMCVYIYIYIYTYQSPHKRPRLPRFAGLRTGLCLNQSARDIVYVNTCHRHTDTHTKSPRYRIRESYIVPHTSHTHTHTHTETDTDTVQQIPYT